PQRQTQNMELKMNLRAMKKTLALAAVSVALNFGLTSTSSGQTTYTWINAATGGAWSTTTNWADINADTVGDIADGADNTANFATLDLTAANTVTFDVDRTLGFMTFADTTPNFNWIVAAGTTSNVLTLQTTIANTTPTITVNNQSMTWR